MSRFKRVLSRAKYAAMGAAVGGFLGGLLNRNAASTAAGIGGLVGAVVGEKRVDVSTVVENVKQKKSSRSGDD